jgi:hypothetical protein
MATVREGTAPVLLVVDVQVGVMRDAWTPRGSSGTCAVRSSAPAPRAFRYSGCSTRTKTCRREASSGNGFRSWCQGEASPFFTNTSTHPLSKPPWRRSLKLGATHVVLAGAATNWCIRATAYGALERGYDLTLVKDAHTTETMELGDLRENRSGPRHTGAQHCHDLAVLPWPQERRSKSGRGQLWQAWRG